jgi:fermentation-respiration switch protein FrsA (DUF1100 family)
MYVPSVQGFTTVDTNPLGYRSPTEYGLTQDDYVDTFVRTADGESIHLWLLRNNPRSDIVFLDCHGNAGNLGLRLPSLVATMKNLPVDVCIFDYRGFGSSTGKPGERGMMLDVEAVHEWLIKSRKYSSVILHGRSVGGSLVVQFAAKLAEENRASEIKGLIVENTFTSIGDLVDTIFPFLWFLVKIEFLKNLILRIKWETAKHLIKIHKATPLLLLSSMKDEIVPHSHRVALAKLAEQHKMNVKMEGFPTAGHNDTWLSGKKYWDVQLEWLAKAIKK